MTSLIAFFVVLGRHVSSFAQDVIDELDRAYPFVAEFVDDVRQEAKRRRDA